MKEEEKNAFNKMYEACLNTIGIYSALKLIGADKHLPGFKGCKKTVDEAINEGLEILNLTRDEVEVEVFLGDDEALDDRRFAT